MWLKQKDYSVKFSHLVQISPWPFCSSLMAFILVFGQVWWWHGGGWWLWSLGGVGLLTVSLLWWADVSSESMSGEHTSVVIYGFRFGMALFILSEVFFFVSFFWGFFHKCFSPALELGCMWPPAGFESIVIDPFSVPLLKTVMLLSSGATVTWAHHSLVSGKYKLSNLGLFTTMFLGGWFLSLQLMEYSESVVSLNSTIYGSVFFLLTGFHGGHVTMGTIFLGVCLIRGLLGGFSSGLHVSFELCAWYWHFVDVVWLFLYLFVYWYGYIIE